VNVILVISTKTLTERLGWALVHFLWQGAVIAALYLMVRAPFTRPERAGVRYVLACLALLAMIAAPAVTLISSGAPRPVPSVTYITGAHTAPSGAGPHGAAIPFGSLPTTAHSTRYADVMTWLVIIWLTGTAVLWIRLIGGCIAAARMKSLRVCPPPLEWQDALNSLRVRLRVSIPVRLLVSGFVQTPAVVGWLKPAVLLPAATITGISPEHIEALLAHELAHIRRHDYLVNVLQRLAETLLFYHPAVWWLSSQISAEREACCDDVAVALTGDTLNYVCALATLESHRPEHLTPALAANGGSLQNRIARLLGQPLSSTRPLPGAGLLAGGLLVSLTVCGLVAQAVDTRPGFEVASLKPDNSLTGVDRIKRSAGSLIIENVSLKRLIGMAYGVADGRDYLFKGPDWLDAESFDISAKFPPETSDSQELLMLQRLLDERFHLKLHREPREFSVYALVVDKRGPKVRPSATPGPNYKFSVRGGHAAGTSLSMAQFADRLSRQAFQVGRPVVDFTGLAGAFDLTLDFQPESEHQEGGSTDSDRASIFSALPEQLGLRLEPRRVSLDLIVVDAALKVPVEN
jgi:uncharacterized protein (TIGR03435 family)